MKNILLICKKELKSYFASPIAYLLLGFFAIVFGFVFYSAVRDFVRQGMQMQMMGRGMPMDLSEWVTRPLLGFASTIGLFLTPLITMRLYAEEKRSGTIELLLTSPVRDSEVIVGKWLAALILYACVVGLCLLNFILLFIYGRPDVKPILIGFLGLVLQGGCLLAIGTLISTMTRNQIIAAAVTFFVCLLLWLISLFTAFDTTGWAQVVNYLSIVTHFEGFSKGVMDSKDVIFYLSMIFLGLFLTARSMESLRWRA